MSKNKNPLTQNSGATTNIILTIVVVIVAIAVIGGVLLFNRGGSSGDGAGGGQAVAADVLRKPDSNLLSEAPDGKVTVVEFLDYQCPACHTYYQNLTKKVERDYQGKITFVARNYPLDMHKLAQPAAVVVAVAEDEVRRNTLEEAHRPGRLDVAAVQDQLDAAFAEQLQRCLHRGGVVVGVADDPDPHGSPVVPRCRYSPLIHYLNKPRERRVYRVS